MPGKQVKDWKLYHKLRRKKSGKKRMSKRSAAKLANWIAKRRR